MSTLKRLFRKFWDIYPKEPLVYVSSHNGVTGVVRAEDFDDEVRRMRKLFRRDGGKPVRAVRPQVYPVFLFSDKTPSNRSFRVGTLDDLETFLNGCFVEQRVFELPPIDAPGFTPYGYYGLIEEVGREGTRHRLYSFGKARSYIYPRV